ncbi:hypothetical protein [Marinoscillum sp.]|uniref:hypothetical protein n=1 Tax=Marinoscillum sp. TaxID=2024838 RepID=UPI003BAA3352
MFEKLFGRKSGTSLKMRYSNSERQWQVYSDGNLVFVGDKVRCENFISNSNLNYQGR